MVPRLDQFARELIGITSTFLAEADLYNLRLTCKEFEISTLSCFRRAYFSSRTVSLGGSSLETLVAISKHPSLCAGLKNLDFSLLRAKGYNDDIFDRNWTLLGPDSLQKLADTTNKPLQECLAMLKQIKNPENDCTNGNLDTNMLTVALSHLPALASIQIGHFKDAGLKAVEKACSASGLMRILQEDNWYPANRYLFTTIHEVEDTIKILSAAACACKSLQHLSIVDSASSLNWMELKIPEQQLKLFKAMTQGLLSLELRLYYGEINCDSITTFLSHMQNLESLDLDLRQSGLSERAIALLNFPTLRECLLSGFSGTADALQTFLERHYETIIDVETQQSKLAGGTWSSVFHSLKKATNLREFYLWDCDPFLLQDIHVVGTSEYISKTLLDL